MSYVDPASAGGLPGQGSIITHVQADDEIIDIEEHQAAISNLNSNAILKANNGSDFADTGTLRLNIHIPSLTPAACVSATNVTPLSGLGTFDNYPLNNGDLILLVGQTNGVQNGLWQIPTAVGGVTGAWVRPTEFFTGNTVKGRTIAITNGAAYGDTIFRLFTPTAGIVIDTAVQTWVSLGSGSASILVPAPTGNAVTDTANSQNALNAAGTGTLFNTVKWQSVPGVNYQINAPLAVTAGTRCTSDGQASDSYGNSLMACLQQANNFPPKTALLNSAKYLASANSADNGIEIDHLLFDGQSVNCKTGSNTIGSGIIIFNRGADVHDNSFVNQAEHCVVSTDRNLSGQGTNTNTQDNHIYNNRMNNMGKHCVWVTSTRSGTAPGGVNTGGCTDGYVHHNVIQYNGLYNNGLPTQIQDFGVTNPFVGYPYEPFHFDDSTGWFVLDNHISGPPGSGIYGRTGWSFAVSRNSVEPFCTYPIPGSGHTYYGIVVGLSGNTVSHLGYARDNKLVGTEAGGNLNSSGVTIGPTSTESLAYVGALITSGSASNPTTTFSHSGNLIYQSSLPNPNVTGCTLVNGSYLTTCPVNGFNGLLPGNLVDSGTASRLNSPVTVSGVTITNVPNTISGGPNAGANTTTANATVASGGFPNVIAGMLVTIQSGPGSADIPISTTVASVSNNVCVLSQIPTLASGTTLSGVTLTFSPPNAIVCVGTSPTNTTNSAYVPVANNATINPNVGSGITSRSTINVSYSVPSVTLTASSATANIPAGVPNSIVVGQVVTVLSGPGVLPAGTTVASLPNNGTSIVLSNGATTGGSVVLAFQPTNTQMLNYQIGMGITDSGNFIPANSWISCIFGSGHIQVSSGTNPFVLPPSGTSTPTPTPNSSSTNWFNVVYGAPTPIVASGVTENVTLTITDGAILSGAAVVSGGAPVTDTLSFPGPNSYAASYGVFNNNCLLTVDQGGGDIAPGVAAGTQSALVTGVLFAGAITVSNVALSSTSLTLTIAPSKISIGQLVTIVSGTGALSNSGPTLVTNVSGSTVTLNYMPATSGTATLNFTSVNAEGIPQPNGLNYINPATALTAGAITILSPVKATNGVVPSTSGLLPDDLIMSGYTGETYPAFACTSTTTSNTPVIGGTFYIGKFVAHASTISNLFISNSTAGAISGNVAGVALTSGTQTITAAGVTVGQTVTVASGTGTLAAGTVVTNVSGNTVTLNPAPTGSGTATLTFTGIAGSSMYIWPSGASGQAALYTATTGFDALLESSGISQYVFPAPYNGLTVGNAYFAGFWIPNGWFIYPQFRCVSGSAVGTINGVGTTYIRMGTVAVAPSANPAIPSATTRPSGLVVTPTAWMAFS